MKKEWCERRINADSLDPKQFGLPWFFDECLYSITHPPRKKSLGHKAVCRLFVQRGSDHVKKFFLVQSWKPVVRKQFILPLFFFLSDSTVMTFCWKA